LPDALLEDRLTYAEYIRMLADRGEFGSVNIDEELIGVFETSIAKRVFRARDPMDGLSKRTAIPCRVAASC
jgi:hypothetical protein